MSKIVAGTGHRPNRCYPLEGQTFERMIELCKASLQKMQATEVISGMAIGFDQALATAAIKLNLPLTAAVPFAEQDAKWTPEDISRWENILFQAKTIVFVDRQDGYLVRSSPGQYHVDKLKKRNQWMIDHCDEVLALYDGGNGGTAHCVGYAESQEKYVLNAWKSWIKYGATSICP
ncbi:hypothetical protein PCC6912_40160 [Chlorogloeopsis fritschii PCC 6912]|uniref:DUF1273 domain-containing protein n=1 Tax=Chlorogloeopsis fritschii PCC 6912 TaxID=211165 RepID=A0A433N6F7_CHLFR|nr:SLOG family protein [Chlorogloeopsis fritschii]RUR77057.1 hypothetical protein PCC6912_40160 [Chlorogloeopsis fritschii PCC 6912]